MKKITAIAILASSFSLPAFAGLHGDVDFHIDTVLSAPKLDDVPLHSAETNDLPLNFLDNNDPALNLQDIDDLPLNSK
ncbi:MAG: hypothetical protein MJA28_11910 [Gammaproteobacteria bacterium]|nr:hypothetical protein [Gammaproteobacteria bacterium]